MSAVVFSLQVQTGLLICSFFFILSLYLYVLSLKQEIVSEVQSILDFLRRDLAQCESRILAAELSALRKLAESEVEFTTAVNQVGSLINDISGFISEAEEVLESRDDERIIDFSQHLKSSIVCEKTSGFSALKAWNDKMSANLTIIELSL